MKGWIAVWALAGMIFSASPFAFRGGLTGSEASSSPKTKTAQVGSGRSRPGAQAPARGPAKAGHKSVSRSTRKGASQNQGVKTSAARPSASAFTAAAQAAEAGILSTASERPTDEPRTTSVEDTICSLNAEKLDLAQALRQISTMTRANLLLLTSSDQKLTIRLSDVKMIEMLRHVCALTGMRYLKVGQTYVVAPEDKLKAAYPVEWVAAFPPPPTKPVPEAPKPITILVLLKNVTGDKAADVVKKAFPQGTLTAVPGPQYTSPSLQARQAGNTTGVSTTATERSDSAGMSKAVVLMGLPEEVAKAKEILEAIDRARKQVVISVSIHDITNDALRDLGIPWTFGDVSITESSPNGLNLGSFSRAPQSLGGQLKALEKSTAAKLLAAPSLSVLDGESAFILIGDKINYPVLVGYTQNNAPIFSKETERVGIYLQLSCQVGEDGTITLTVYPQVSTVTGYLEVNGASYPQIATREAQTTLRFKSGETVVMGGLLKDEEIRVVERVPILSQIPFLGEIFTHRKKTRASSQVIISITPIILRDE